MAAREDNVESNGRTTNALGDVSNLVTSIITEATDRAEASVREVEQHLSQTASAVMSKTQALIQARPLAVLGGMVLLGMAVDRLFFARKAAATSARPLSKSAPRGKIM